MSKQPVLDAKKAEKLLLDSGYVLIRTKGSHRIYKKVDNRIVLPFHSGKNLHPKITKAILEATKSKEDDEGQF
ncbi:MAG: YcfA family protein [Ignavibacteria bacterium]|nr:YcfA family protein [Ignavibacteria bacterium]